MAIREICEIDDALDQERDTLQKKIERDELVAWNEDDLLCIRRAEEIWNKNDVVITNEAGRADQFKDNKESDDPEHSSIDESARDDEALEQFIPDDIANDPRPREDR